MRTAFHGFELDLQQGRLLRGDREVALEPRTYELLRYLVEHPDRLVTKLELMNEVWRSRSLSGGVIGNAIAKLRQALGQAGHQNAPIETVHGRGYRFHLQARQPGPPSDPFIGRAAVMQALAQRLERAKSGSGSLVVLSGPAGIGKTRTAHELAAQARAQGIGVWVGAAYEGAHTLPYWPWIQLLRNAREELTPPVWESQLPDGPSALRQLLPETHAVGASISSVEPAAARFALFDEFARFLSAATSGRALLVLLDDLHWTDEGSLELLAFVARALEQRPVMIVANLREDELALADRKPTCFESLGRQAFRLPLPGLSLPLREPNQHGDFHMW